MRSHRLILPRRRNTQMGRRVEENPRCGRMFRDAGYSELPQFKLKVRIGPEACAESLTSL